MTICNICQEQITNPICPRCIAKSIEIWLMQKNPKLVDIIRFRLGMFECADYNDNEIKCIKCGDCINICMYCSTQEIYDWIKEHGDDITIKEFPFK